MLFLHLQGHAHGRVCQATAIYTLALCLYGWLLSAGCITLYTTVILAGSLPAWVTQQPCPASTAAEPAGRCVSGMTLSAVRSSSI